MRQLRRVLARRLATQRVTSAGASGPAAAVRLLLAVQAQDPPLSRYSVGLRTRAGTDATVRRALDDGAILRTHILRPTWHMVAADDIRPLLALTSARVESSTAGRRRELAIDEATITAAFAVLQDALTGGRSLTRRELHPILPTTAVGRQNEVVAHLLSIAELRGLICSGPLRVSEAGGRRASTSQPPADHTYALLDDRVPLAPTSAREELVRWAVQRFFSGHGPASVADLTRWCAVTQTEVRAALHDLDGSLASVTMDGTELWFDPEPPPRSSNRRSAVLLPRFDEAYLTYRITGFPRAPDHPLGDKPLPLSEAGGGIAVHDLREVGHWKRTVVGDVMRVTVFVGPSVDDGGREALAQAAAHLAGFTGHQLALVWGSTRGLPNGHPAAT